MSSSSPRNTSVFLFKRFAVVAVVTVVVADVAAVVAVVVLSIKIAHCSFFVAADVCKKKRCYSNQQLQK